MTDDKRDARHDSCAAAYAALIDAEGLVRCEIPCQKCGYNLKASVATTNCAECGSPIVNTLKAKVFVLQSPDLLVRIGRSVWWMLAAYIMFAGWHTFLFVPNPMMSIVLASNTLSLVVSIGVPQLWVILFTIGVVRVTSVLHDDQNSMRSSELLRRRSHRRALYCLASVLIIAVFHVSNRIMLIPAVDYVRVLGELVVTACLFAALWAVCDYMRVLTTRLANDRLSKHALVVKYGLLASLALDFTRGLSIHAWNIWEIPTGLIEVWQLVLLAAPAIQFIFGFWGVVLLFALRHRISGATKIAREITASA